MKKVLLVSLLAIAGVSISAQNLIKNEKFATEVTNKVTNPSKATAGEWFIMNNEASNNNRLGADWRCQVSERDENR